ncbi:MAG: CDP-diacylglycerol--glycerol-3-phosphate 3-phosphatidyltransferase [Bdellovibrionales bacterium CG10_big_fil_rev_8_21_14_0_10_45_34]|nr:MAG: CDP-diacylglycerol--glycerol-3-phosphate 3-phosphatidyltransferase [Bdellovibrionales bacterium CG10_big_fil_rev_8_21_14_0_10_45_34]
MNHQLSRWKRSLPNWLTLFRVVLVAPIIVLLLRDQIVTNWICAGLFILASLTDYIDGYLARKMDVVSNFGKLMDPVADKILVSATLVMLIPTGRLEAIMVVILISRDVFIDGLRALAGSQGIIISAGKIGKWKTATQMVGIPAILLQDIGSLPVSKIGYWVLWFSVVLSIVSGIKYYLTYLRKAPIDFMN